MAITRPAFDEALDPITPQRTIIYYQQTTEAATWHILNQGRKFDTNPKAQEASYKGIGRTTASTSRGSTEVTATVTVYMQSDLREAAALLGIAKPAGGWAGTEQIRLDGTKKVNLKAVTFAGTDTGDAELFTEYLMGFGPSDMKKGVDADNGDAQVIEMSGPADDYYWTPVED